MNPTKSEGSSRLTFDGTVCTWISSLQFHTISDLGRALEVPVFNPLIVQILAQRWGALVKAIKVVSDGAGKSSISRLPAVFTATSAMVLT